MTIAIAILMKDPADAKTRLKSALASDAREKLALLLFENTLGFFRQFSPGAALAVVTPSKNVAEIAQGHGAIALLETTQEGINGAAGLAVEWALASQVKSLLVVHADVATLVATEMSALIDAGDLYSVVIGESHDGGTNALLLSPPDAIPFRFGRGSAVAHEAAAKAFGRSCVRLKLLHLCRDIDTPDDLISASSTRRETPSIGLTAAAISGIPEVAVGDDLPQLIEQALRQTEFDLRPYDIVVIAQKVVSKCEGRMFPLGAFHPSERAKQIASEIGKDERKVEAILSESTEVIRARRQDPEGLLITRHRHGWICANAGIDESNLGQGKEGMLLLLPEDPDASAARVRAHLEQRFGGPIGVVVTDTFGRPWRHGLVNVAIGVAGIPAVLDWTTRADAYGRMLKATLPAFADELAAAAGLLMQKDAGFPAIVFRGVHWNAETSSTARDLLRPISQELFL